METKRLFRKAMIICLLVLYPCPSIARRYIPEISLAAFPAKLLGVLLCDVIVRQMTVKMKIGGNVIL